MSPEHDLIFPLQPLNQLAQMRPRKFRKAALAKLMSEPASSSVSMAASANSTGTGAAVARAPETRSGDNGVTERAAAATEPATTNEAAGAIEAASAAEIAQPAASADSRQ